MKKFSWKKNSMVQSAWVGLAYRYSNGEPSVSDPCGVAGKSLQVLLGLGYGTITISIRVN